MTARRVDNIMLPKRQRDTHKGSYGKLAVFCGGRGYTGAGTLCVNAAIRAGAGVVYAVVPETVHDVYAKKLLTCVIIPADSSAEAAEAALCGKDALCAGPGFGTGAAQERVLRRLLCAPVSGKLFDADATTIIARDTDMLKNAVGDIVLTPHPAEFSRMTGISVQDVLKSPAECAHEFAQKYGVTLLLKGADTHIACGSDVFVSSTGSPAMAKGGSGDVLSGVISSFMAQGRSGVEAACIGAYLCGLAGERAAEKYGEYSATPKETIDSLIAVIKAHTQR